MAEKGLVVKDVKIALQAGSKRDVYASWSFSQSHTEKYEYEWEYTTSGINANKQVWFDGGGGSVDHPTKTATYSTPANATKIRFRVKPVSETKKENKEDVSYFTGSWSTWKDFWGFEFSSNPDPWQVPSKDLTIEPYLKGTGFDSQPYVEVSWPITCPVSLTPYWFKYLKGFDYKWEYRQDSDYSTVEKGSRYIEVSTGSVNDLTDAERTNLLKGKTVTRSARLNLEAQTVGSTTFAIYDAVRFTVTPTATEDGAFRPVSNSIAKTINFDTVRIKKDKIKITASKTTDEFTAFWTVDSSRFDHIASFDVVWEYADDPKNYFEPVPRQADGIWMPGGTGTVNKDDGEVVVSTTGTKKTVMRYRFAFKPSTVTATEYPTVRVKVKAVCDDTKSFIEEFSAWKTYSFTIPTKQVELLEVSSPNPLNPRHMKATWQMIQSDDLASFSYSYVYKTSNNGLFSAPSTGSVDVSQVQIHDSGPGMDTWGVEFDLPSDAKTGEFTVTPVAKVATAFTGTPDSITMSVKDAVVLTVKNVHLYIQNTENRIVYATWDDLDVQPILDTGVTLEDLGLPPGSYPAETMESMVRDAVLNGYDVKWEYYFLDKWIAGTGSSTTQSTTSEYTVPEEASKIKVSIKPVSSNEAVMVGTYSVPYVEGIVPESLTIGGEGALDLDWYGDENQTFAARFTAFKEMPALDTNRPLPNVPRTLPDVTFEWSFYRYGGWESVEEETVTPNLELDYLLSTKEIPVNSKKVRVRLKPVIDTLEYYGLYGDFVERDIVIPDAYVTNLDVIIQKGTKRTCVALWEDPTDIEPDTVSNYSYEWQYSIDNIWYDGSNGTASITALNSTYDAPDNAEEVRVRVKPEPVLERYFTGAWVDYVVFKVPDDITPEVPSVPSVEMIDIYNFKATVDTYDTKTSQIAFEVVNETSLWRNANIDVQLNRAVFQFNVASGHVYRVRAAGINMEGEQGEWSNYSSDIASAPPPLDTPPVIRATNDNTVEISWEAPTVGVIKSYTIEYAKKQSYFDAAPSQVQSQDIQTGTTAILENLDASEWFFRICSVNDAGQSDWVYAEPITLGSVPTAPTTWSSRTSATIGEEIYLYWTHNCADESAESSAVVNLTVNGIGPIEYIVEPPEDGSASYFKIESVAAAEFSETVDYTAGQYVTYEGAVYQFDTDHSAGAWDDSQMVDVTGAVIANESTIEWKVQTAGVLTEWDEYEEDYMPVYGDWSTQRIVKVYSPPSLQISIGSQVDWEWDTFNFNEDNIYNTGDSMIGFPNNEVTAFPILISLNAYPVTQTPTAYVMSVISNNSYEEIDSTGTTRRINIGQEIFKKYYNTQQRNFTTILTPDIIDLENGSSYTINVTVSMDSGLTAEVSETFSVAWQDEDYILNAETSIDTDALIAYIRPYAMDDNEAYPANVRLSVFRRQFDGSFVKIGEKLSNLERPVVVDPHPTLDYARYRIVAQSTVTGAITYYDLPAIPIKDTSIVLQWDEEWSSYTESNADGFSEQPWTGSMLKLPYNVKVADSNQIDIEPVEYIGRRHPVSYYGTQVGQKMTLSSDVDKANKETIYALRRLAAYMGDVYVREPNGAGYWAHVSVSMSIDYDAMIVPVSIDVTRVEGGV